MSQLLAFLGDSFREAMDRRTLLVLLVLAAIVIFFCFSLSFEVEGLEKVLADQAAGLGSIQVPGAGPFGGGMHSSVGAAPAVGEVARVAGGEWPPALQGGLRVDLKFEKAEDLDRLARRWKEARERRPGRARKEAPEPQETPDAGSRLAFLGERFRHFGYNHVEVRELRSEPPEYRVAVRSDYPQEIAGAHHMAIGFGLWRLPLEGVSVAEVIVGIQVSLANVFAGFVGMLISLVVSSSFVPSMLQKGTLDFLLARPLGRARILLFKYLGGIWFIFVLASFLIGGSWLGLSLRTSYFNPWFLATIITVTAIFAVLYSVSVLFGVLTRSGAVSALLAIGVWGLSGTIVSVRQTLKLMVPPGEVPIAVTKSLVAAYAILPKTGDIASLNALFLSRSRLSPAALERLIPAESLKVDWSYSLGTTALFAAVMLGLAIWFFRRRDW